MIREIIDQSVYFYTYQKFLKNILNQQASAHFESIFSKQQTGFCHGFNTQYCLLVMLKSLEKY